MLDVADWCVHQVGLSLQWCSNQVTEGTSVCLCVPESIMFCRQMAWKKASWGRSQTKNAGSGLKSNVETVLCSREQGVCHMCCTTCRTLEQRNWIHVSLGGGNGTFLFPSLLGGMKGSTICSLCYSPYYSMETRGMMGEYWGNYSLVITYSAPVSPLFPQKVSYSPVPIPPNHSNVGIRNQYGMLMCCHVPYQLEAHR